MLRFVRYCQSLKWLDHFTCTPSIYESSSCSSSAPALVIIDLFKFSPSSTQQYVTGVFI